MSIAAFELVETKGLYDLILDLPITDPLSPNFEAVGFESLFIIYNLGSVTLVALIVSFLMVIMTCIRNTEFDKRI